MPAQRDGTGYAARGLRAPDYHVRGTQGRAGPGVHAPATPGSGPGAEALPREAGAYARHRLELKLRDPANLWFCVLDVLRALDDEPYPKKKYNVTDALQGLGGDELVLIELTDVTGRKQDMACVYESGLYFLIGKSRKESARKFQAWVRKEVLPSVNRTGGYGTQQLTVIPPASANDGPLALALHEIGGAMRAVVEPLRARNT